MNKTGIYSWNRDGNRNEKVMRFRQQNDPPGLLRQTRGGACLESSSCTATRPALPSSQNIGTNRPLIRFRWRYCPMLRDIGMFLM